MKQRILQGLMLVAGIAFAQAQDLPVNPPPGKCYVKCITKDTFKDVTETIQVYPAYNKLKVVPATYTTVEEKVLIKEATKKFVYVPATYETVNVDFVKKESRNDLKVIPATFGSSSKTFETNPATSGWEYRVLEDCPSVNKEACVAACFVEHPAQFRDVPFTTLANDAKTEAIPVASQTGTYSKSVIITPARVNEIEIPAKYSTIKKQVIATPASTTSETVAAKSETITRTVLDQKGGISSWAEVECDLLDPTIIPIFYETASARLTPASKKVIDDMLLPLLNSKPVDIELRSHTDSRGNADYNKSLSQQRANAVVNYLVSKGIKRNRLTAKGYGEFKLTNRCADGVKCSDNEHAKNRRTEFRVLSKTN